MLSTGQAAALCFAGAPSPVCFIVAVVVEGGSIGFVGLVVPHMIRMTGVWSHRYLIPMSACVGGAMVVVADTLARSVWAPVQLPVGVMTALIGVPILIYLLNKRSDVRN